MDNNYTYEVTKGNDSNYKVKVSVSEAKYREAVDQSYNRLAKDVKLPGFRAGKAPRVKVEAALGNKLTSEAISFLLPNIAAEIADKESFNPITQLEYELLKMSDAGVEFSFSFVNYPEIKLANMSKLKVKKQEKPKVTQKEIDDVIARLFDKDKPSKEKPSDKMVKELGMPGVSTLAELEKQVVERLETAKETDAERQYEDNVLKAAISSSSIPIPDALLEQQTHSLMHSYFDRIKDLNVDVNDFLKAQGLTEEELRKQKEEEAKQKIQVELLLNQVAAEHKLFPHADEVQLQLDSITDTQVKQQLDTPAGRRYILSTLIQQRGMQKLLELAGSSKKSAKQKQK